MEEPKRLDDPRREHTATDGGAAERRAAEVPCIGPYRLLHCIGEGGIGQVWLADQSEPVKRRVAVKVIKAGMDTRQVVARFESERQALALMNHAAIAKVFDGGSTPEGKPYFVMEYVAGVSITEHCDRHKLSTTARLELLGEVCAGVQHAHQKAIIHRDLKPSNILVMLADGKSQPKIIDFGVAKATGQRLTDHTLQTVLGAIIGTPEYMSPEQADLTGQDVDTRTDVYSLGVVLYELLTGELPFASRDLRSSGEKELRRKLREVEPPRPSARVSTPGPKTAEAARNRDTEPAALRNLLKGDLDAITMKALEKERGRRYGTPSELAADIQRYLHHEPVLAQPPSVRYRTKKYVQRHTTLVAGAAAVFAALLAGVIVSAWQAQRARSAERRAASEAAVAKATSDFLQNDLLGQADVSRQSGLGSKPDPDIKVRTVLDRAAASMEGKFDQQPEVEASVRQTIGEAYQGLGVYPEARKQLERALELRRKVFGTESPQTLRTQVALASVADLQGKYQEAEESCNQTLAIQRTVLGPEHPDTLEAMTCVARALKVREKYAQAEELDKQILEVRRRVLGLEHRKTLSSMTSLAAAYKGQGKYKQAEALDRQVLEIRHRMLGAEHPATLQSMLGLANTYKALRKLKQAEELFSQGLDIRRRVLGPEHPDTVLTMRDLAFTYIYQGKYEQAETLLQQTVEIHRRVLGAEHPSTMYSLNSLAYAYELQGKYTQAETLQQQTLAIRRRTLGAEHVDTLLGMNNLGLLYRSEGKNAQAEALHRQTLEIQRRVLGAEHPRTLLSLFNLGTACQVQGKYAEAEALHRQTLEIRRRVLGGEHPFTLLTMRTLADDENLLGRYAEAEALASQALQITRLVLDPESPDAADAMDSLAAVYRNQGKLAQAEALFLEAIEIKRRALGPDRRPTLESLAGLALVYSLQGKLAHAETLQVQTLAARRRGLGAEHPDTLDAMADLALTYQAEGKFNSSEALAREAVGGESKRRPESWQRYRSASLLGRSLSGQKKYAAAEPLLLEGVRGMDARKQQIAVPDRYYLERVREWLVQLYQAWGKPAQAAEWRKPSKDAPEVDP
jgi:serine/threonine protein kinase/tetratricopeptide (TPR) repeat protein